MFLCFPGLFNPEKKETIGNGRHIMSDLCVAKPLLKKAQLPTILLKNEGSMHMPQPISIIHIYIYAHWR